LDCESMVRPTRAGATLAERWGALRWGDSGASWQPDLIEATEFGSNPGDLRMLSFVPRKAKAGAALVVALHGCGQTAASYDHGIGWSKLADRLGFALLLPNRSARTTSTAASAGSARPTWSGTAVNRCRFGR
jgi:poly(3-hydroxybutyrate) depolymerase